jgi:hypothetical protein
MADPEGDLDGETFGPGLGNDIACMQDKDTNTTLYCLVGALESEDWIAAVSSTSTDGIVWSMPKLFEPPRTFAKDSDERGIENTTANMYNPETMWVATSDTVFIATITALSTPSDPKNPFPRENWAGLARSTDGLNWTIHRVGEWNTGDDPNDPATRFGASWSGIVYCKRLKMFVAVGRTGDYQSPKGMIYTSVDEGLTWSSIDNPFNAIFDVKLGPIAAKPKD